MATGRKDFLWRSVVHHGGKSLLLKVLLCFLCKQAFFTAHILTCHSGKSTGVTHNINDVSDPSVPVSYDSVTVSQHAQYQDPGTEAAEWNSAIINLIIYTCASPTGTCQNVFSHVSSIMISLKNDNIIYTVDDCCKKYIKKSCVSVCSLLQENWLFSSPPQFWKVLHLICYFFWVTVVFPPSSLYTHYLFYGGNLGPNSNQFENRQQCSASTFCVRVIGIAKQNAIIG